MCVPSDQPWLLVQLCIVLISLSVIFCGQDLRIIDGQPQNWTEAVHTCVKNGLQIAQPSTAEKSSQLQTQFFSAMNSTTLNISWVWIGLKYDIPTKAYYWQDGTSMTWSNWDKGQPNNSKQNSFICAKIQIQNEFNWAIENCSVSFQVLCETPESKPAVQVNGTNKDVIEVINSVVTTPNMNISKKETVTEVAKAKDDSIYWPSNDIPIMIVLGLGVLLTLGLICIGYAAWTCFLQSVVEGKSAMGSNVNEYSPLQHLR